MLAYAIITAARNSLPPSRDLRWRSSASARWRHVLAWCRRSRKRAACELRQRHAARPEPARPPPPRRPHPRGGGEGRRRRRRRGGSSIQIVDRPRKPPPRRGAVRYHVFGSTALQRVLKHSNSSSARGARGAFSSPPRALLTGKYGSHAVILLGIGAARAARRDQARPRGRAGALRRLLVAGARERRRRPDVRRAPRPLRHPRAPRSLPRALRPSVCAARAARRRRRVGRQGRQGQRRRRRQSRARRRRRGGRMCPRRSRQQLAALGDSGAAAGRGWPPTTATMAASGGEAVGGAVRGLAEVGAGGGRAWRCACIGSGLTSPRPSSNASASAMLQTQSGHCQRAALYSTVAIRLRALLLQWPDEATRRRRRGRRRDEHWDGSSSLGASGWRRRRRACGLSPRIAWVRTCCRRWSEPPTRGGGRGCAASPTATSPRSPRTRRATLWRRSSSRRRPRRALGAILQELKPSLGSLLGDRGGVVGCACAR